MAIRRLRDRFRKRRRVCALEIRRELSPIPDLNINDFIRFQRLTDSQPQQRIRLAQTEKRVRFLVANWSKSSVFQSAANVMRAIAIVREIDGQLRRQLRQIEIR